MYNHFYNFTKIISKKVSKFELVDATTFFPRWEKYYTCFRNTQQIVQIL